MHACALSPPQPGTTPLCSALAHHRPLANKLNTISAHLEAFTAANELEGLPQIGAQLLNNLGAGSGPGPTLAVSCALLDFIFAQLTRMYPPLMALCGSIRHALLTHLYVGDMVPSPQFGMFSDMAEAANEAETVTAAYHTSETWRVCVGGAASAPAAGVVGVGERQKSCFSVGGCSELSFIKGEGGRASTSGKMGEMGP